MGDVCGPSSLAHLMECVVVGNKIAFFVGDDVRSSIMPNSKNYVFLEVMG
jgi:hypothetical protein